MSLLASCHGDMLIKNIFFERDVVRVLASRRGHCPPRSASTPRGPIFLFCSVGSLEGIREVF